MLKNKKVFKAHVYRSANDVLGNFVIRVDDEIDMSYIEALESARKRKAIKYAVLHSIVGVGRFFITTGLYIRSTMDTNK